jgi:hypothetical protein
MKRDRHYLFLLVLVALVVCGAAARQSFAEAPVKSIEMAKIDKDSVVSGQLSEPQTADGKTYRVVKPGQGVVLAIDPWWGDGVQPGEGAMYIATVVYKDSLKQPGIFLSYAGLGTGEGPSEMHRFGGLDDGKWKEARVPLSWDMVLRDFDSGKVKLGIRSSEELAVASIDIRAANKDAGDEQRYNAETREWVRRAQADLKPAAAQSRPSLPEAMVGRTIVPYVRPYVRVVLPQDVPQASEAGAPIRVRMTANEYEPGTFAVYAPKEKLTNVTYEVGPLKNDTGELAVQVQRGTIEYTLKAPSKPDRPAEVVAERIWPMYAVDVEPGCSQWFWITLKTDPAKSKPGKYAGQVTIKADQGQAALPIAVEILPFVLVALDRAALTYGGCHPALLPEHEMRELLEHNLNIMNIWAGAVGPRIKFKDGKMTLDFRFMDYWMRQARVSGIRGFVWFLGGVPYGYPRTLSIEREIYIALHEGEKPSKELYEDFIQVAATQGHRGRTLPEVEPYYRQWVREVWKHSRANDWPELIMTPFDEAAMWVQGPYRTQAGSPHMIGAGPWIRDHFEFACKLLHEEAPGMRVYASIHGNSIPGPNWKPQPGRLYPRVREGQVFIDDIDVMCTNAVGDDPHLGETTTAMGKDFWQYSGGDSRRPDRVRYTFGFFFSAYNSRGGLFWAYDWGNGWDTSRGANWWLAWHTPFGVIPSPAYECLREALDDRRYVETLKRMAADHQTEVRDFLAELAKAAISVRTEGGRDNVNDFFAESRDMDATDAMRAKVIEKIKEVSTKGWPTSRPYPEKQ